MPPTRIGPYAQLLEEEPSTTLQTEGGDAEDGRKKRLALLARALYGEFCCTTIFFSCVFGSLAKCHIAQFDNFQTGLTVSFTASFVAVAVIFCYSSVSGAHFNSAISFALWLTGKLSNRKLLLYWVAQLSGSLMALCFVYLTFTSPGADLFHAIAVIPEPNADLWRIFNTEFIATLVLTYTVFHIAFETVAEERRAESASIKSRLDDGESGEGLTVYTTAPQSKGAFTPFIFGFLLFGLLQWGGASGAAMNPLRLLAPAIVSGQWDGVWIYLLGQLAGAASGGAIVHWAEHLLNWETLVSAGEGAAGALDGAKTRYMLSST